MRPGLEPGVRTRLQLLDDLRAVAADTLDWHGPLDEGSRLVEDLELDSLRALTLLIEVENRLRIRIDPADEALLATVGDLLTVIQRRLEEPPEST
jgi:acyl carrier protein